ncbi:MAG: hypothetical protein HY519_04325, partial [Candidatus Aenigmarchaeota archaeon]|nr:hypothetical protein [Candidatus Aenigmarchaeota archaeon]
GPTGGWTAGAARVGIVLSDELTVGSECGTSGPNYCTESRCPAGRRTLEAGIKGAKDNDVKVFPLRAYPCGVIQYPNDPVPRNFSRPGSPEYFICSCGEGLLVDWMQEMADQTGGSLNKLSDATKVSDSIKDILSSIPPRTEDDITAGTDLKVPREQQKRIFAYEFSVPTPLPGTYTKAYVYKWT